MLAEKIPVVAEESLPQDGGDKSAHSVKVASVSSDSESPAPLPTGQVEVPFKWKIASILIVSAIGFGSQWSSGVTGAMKSTIKKVSIYPSQPLLCLLTKQQMNINNTQFALLEASEDFMVTALMLVSGIVTDRIGGAGMKQFKIAISPTMLF